MGACCTPLAIRWHCETSLPPIALHGPCIRLEFLRNTVCAIQHPARVMVHMCPSTDSQLTWKSPSILLTSPCFPKAPLRSRRMIWSCAAFRSPRAACNTTGWETSETESATRQCSCQPDTRAWVVSSCRACLASCMATGLSGYTTAPAVPSHFCLTQTRVSPAMAERQLTPARLWTCTDSLMELRGRERRCCRTAKSP